MLSILSNLTST